MSFESEVEKHRSSMLKVAQRVLHNRDDAEDAVVQATMKAWRQYDRRDFSRSYGGYLVTAARRQALDMLRTRTRAPKTEPIQNHAANLPDLTATVDLDAIMAGNRLLVIVAATIAKTKKSRPPRKDGLQSQRVA